MSGRAEPGTCCDCWASDVCPATRQMEKMREQRNESMEKHQVHYAAQLDVRRVRGKSAGRMSDQLAEVDCVARKPVASSVVLLIGRELGMDPAWPRLKYWAVRKRRPRFNV